MITVVFVSFKCCIQLRDEDHVGDHLGDVHGINGGIRALTPQLEIEVNASIPFKVPDLTKLEEFDPDKKVVKVN